MIKIKQFVLKHNQLIRYAFFGIFSASANWIVYALLINLLSVDLSAVNYSDNAIFEMLSGESGDNLIKLFFATIVSWFANVSVAFITNKIWVFKSKDNSFRGILREVGVFFNAHLFTGCIEWFGTPALVMIGLNQGLFGIEGFFAKISISIIVMTLNYVFSKLVVFRDKNIRAGEKEIEDKNQKIAK